MPTVEREACGYIIRGGDYGRGHGTLIQTDWDYPSVARDCGWNMRRVQPDRLVPCRLLTMFPRLHGPDAESRCCHCHGRGEYMLANVRERAPRHGIGCDHSGTDGTVDCRDCGVTASAFIAAAQTYLDSIAR